MADQDEVLIKIAADISSAVEALSTLTEQMGEVVKSIGDVGKESADSEDQTKSFWETWVSGAENGTTASVLWGEQMSKAFDSLKEGLSNAITSLPNMVAKSAALGDELQTMSNRLNISVGSIGQLQYIADQSGASMQGMARTIQGLGAALQDSENKQTQAIAKLGLNVKALKDAKPEEAYFKILETIKQTVPVAEQAGVAMVALGGRFRSQTMLLKEDLGGLRAAYAKLGDSAEDLAKLAKEGDRYSDNLNDIRLVQEKWQHSIAEALLPTINDLLETMPGLGGAVLTVGEGFLDTAKTILPMIGNIALLKSSGLGGWVAETVGGLPGVSTAMGGVKTALGGLTGALLPLTIAIAGAAAIWATWKAANAESGWIRSMSDGVERLGLMFMGFSKAERDAAIATDHATQKSVEAAEAAKKHGDATKDLGAAVTTTRDEMALLVAKTAEVKKEYEAIKGPQATQIAALYAQNVATKEIAEATGISAAALELFKKKLEEQKKAAEAAGAALKKLHEDTAVLASGMTQAAASGATTAQMLEAFGKKSADAVKAAALIPGELEKIPPKVRDMATAFNESQIAEKLKAINEKVLELSKSFSEKLTAATKTASDAIKSMQNEMALNMMTASEQRLARIQLEREKAIEGVTAQKDAVLKSLADQETALKKQYEAARKAVTDQGGLTKEVTAEKIAAIDKEEATVIAAERTKTAITIAEQNKQLGVVTQTYDQRIAIENKATGNFEKDAELRGLKTKAVYKAEGETQAEKLAFMLANRAKFTEQDIAIQQKAVGAVGTKELDAQKARLSEMLTGRIKASAEEIAVQQKAVDAGVVAAKKGAADELKAAQDTLAVMQADRVTNSREAIAAQQKIVDAAEAAAGKTKTDWGGALDSLNTAFTQMATIAGGSFGGLLKGIGEVTSGIGVMKSGFKGTMDAFKNAGTSGGFKGLGESFKGALGGGGVGGMLSGLTKGLGTVMPMVGGIIAGVGAAISVGKKIFDLFNKSAGEKAAKEVGKNFGTTITEEAGNAIAKTAKDMFKGDRFAAAIYDMNTIIKTAGGINEKNFSQMADRMHDVFSMIQTGKFTVEQATKVLNENFGAFADYTMKTGRVASKQFTELIRLNKEFGTNSKEIMDFVGAQTSRLGGALSKLAGAQDQTNESMGRFERLAVAGFNAAIAAGVPYLEAIDQMGPALDKIVEGNKKLGREGGAAIAELLKFREVATANKDLVESAGALNEVMLALSNTGALNAETMADLQSQGAETFSKLTAAGFTTDQALQQMKGYLEQVRNAHEDLGLPIDENTQALIAQGEASGVLKARQMDATDVMMTGFSAIIEALGGKIPEAFKKMADSAVTSAGQVATAVGGVGTSVDGVTGKTSQSATAFDQWAVAGTDAAAQVQAGVDGVAEGNSPGGIRGIIQRLMEAKGGFSEFAASGMTAATQVSGAVDTTLGGSLTRTQDSLIKGHGLWDMFRNKGIVAATDAGAAVAGQLAPTIDATSEKLNATPWGEMAKRAGDAAGAVGGAVTGVMGGAILNAHAQIKATPWTEFAQRGIAAGTSSANAISGVKSAIDGAASELASADWSGWADELASAAQQAQDAVDAVSLGSSPGGLKEIPIKIKDAMKSFKAFEDMGVGSAESVRESVDALSGAQANIGVASEGATAATVAQTPLAGAPGGGGGETFHITIQALDSAGVEGITESKVIPAIVKALRKGGRNLTDMTGVLQ